MELIENGETTDLLFEHARLGRELCEKVEPLLPDAFAQRIRDLAEYCLPFVKVGGSFVPMKSAKTQEEIAEGKKAIHVLGGQIAKVDTFDLLDCGESDLRNYQPCAGKKPVGKYAEQLYQFHAPGGHLFCG